MEVSILEDETPVLSRNGGHKLSSEIAPYSRRTETTAAFWFKYQ